MGISMGKDKDKDMISCIIRAEYFSGVNIFRNEYFLGVNISQCKFRIRTDYFGLVLALKRFSTVSSKRRVFRMQSTTTRSYV